MMKNTVRALAMPYFAAAFLILSCICPVFADIDVNAATALVAIESPDGERKSFDPGEDLGAVAEGVVIEILEGSADISLGAGSKCTVRLGRTTLALDGDDYVSLSYDSLDGIIGIRVINGSVGVRRGDDSQNALIRGIDISFADSPGQE